MCEMQNVALTAAIMFCISLTFTFQWEDLKCTAFLSKARDVSGMIIDRHTVRPEGGYSS